MTAQKALLKVLIPSFYFLAFYYICTSLWLHSGPQEMVLSVLSREEMYTVLAAVSAVFGVVLEIIEVNTDK